MKVLIIGTGGREHALAWKIAQSPLVTHIFCSNGNGGTATDFTNVMLTTPTDIIHFCRAESIDLVVIGPETPLVEGLADILRTAGILCFGPSQKAAQLEGSKAFTKDLCRKYHIPTADYALFTDSASAIAYIRTKGAPIVIKADGLAAGKGVIVAMTQAEALDAITTIFSGKFGSAGASIVIEDYLEGEEISFFALSDGKNVVAFGAAQDHKRVGDGDRGANTGGMGTYSPVPFLSATLQTTIMETIIRPTISAMQKEGIAYQGVLFAGLMMTKDGAKLIEYNARFGDPETQSLMMRLDSDIVPVLLACARGDGVEKVEICFSTDTAICVVMATKGYPETYHTGSIIHGLDNVSALPHVKVFHAGTALKDDTIIASGGRVLGITARGNTLTEARDKAYNAIKQIEWEEGFYRHDIGYRAL